MDTGQAIFISSQLILGAAAAFLAILLWPKIREVAWMLIILGTIVAYIETVYSILKIFGITGDNLIIFGSVPLISFILPTVRTLFFIVAFAIIIYKQSRN
jgi:putative exporter of polyketide antibiotics